MLAFSLQDGSETSFLVERRRLDVRIAIVRGAETLLLIERSRLDTSISC